ncbi:MAG: hypothetical protein ACI845_000771 [Gammaproteobacteria bacterium]|jgi:hypothetical protein
MLDDIKKFHSLVFIPLLGVLLLSGCGGDSNDDDAVTLGSVTFAFELSGESTVPQIAATGSGTATLTLNRDSGALSGSATLADLTGSVTAAHIHNAIAGLTGEIIFTLEIDASNALQVNVPDGTTLDATQMTAILNSEHYINIHTAANASGELRGQIIAPDQQVVRVNLKSANEVPTPVDSTNAGTAYITLDTVSGEIRGNIRNTGLDDASGAHIHDAFAGTNGDVLYGLTQDTVDPALWAVPDNTVLNTTQLASLLVGGLYFNVHTPANASGEVRGQLSLGNISVIRSELDGSQEVPSVVTAATGIGYTTVDEESGSINANIRTSGLTVNAAHVHEAAAGSSGGVAFGLTQDTVETDFWSGNATLDAMQLDAFKADGLYFNAHTTANAGGEIRAQINR